MGDLALKIKRTIETDTQHWPVVPPNTHASRREREKIYSAVMERQLDGMPGKELSDTMWT